MAPGVVFDIQHYAVHDGPGIRTLAFLKGCPLRCLWCGNPESHRAAAELLHHAGRCRACFRCVEACSTGAADRGEDGPRIAREQCGGRCGWECVEACPDSALARVGDPLEASLVAGRVAADLPFYRNSGGGVTVSGGEPFAQPQFVLDLLAQCRLLGIHTAVETCGHARPEDLLAAAPWVDLFLFDLKVMEAARHQELTGVPNDLILANLRALAARARERVVVRVPVIPDLTDDLHNLGAIAALARELRISKVELVPYHPFGEEKYTALGRARTPPVSGAGPTPERLEEIGRLFLDLGLPCEVA
jgi:pyruvate formate lyase activating enzyme